MKQFLITSFLLIMTFVPVKAQVNDMEQDENKAIPYQIVEQKPCFNGGDDKEFYKWVSLRLIYPEEAKSQNIQGRIFAQFIVEADGSVSNVTILKGVHPLLDQEVKRVISSSPKWEPGHEEGRAVRVVNSVGPFSFVVAKSDESPQNNLKSDDGNKETIPFQMVEQKPSFKGGNANEFSRWVNSHLVMPESLTNSKSSQSWRVTLQFTIETDGKVDEVKVLNSSGSPEIDAEAVRVVSMSPKWTPGFQHGEPARVTFTFPVIFQIR